MRSQLERAINLAADTGDKIIVVDEMNDRSSVVMNLDEYEKLLKGQNKGRIGIKNLTEEELLDKINHDIVSWKDANSEKKFFEDFDSPFAKATGDKDEFEEELDFDEDSDEDDELESPFASASPFAEATEDKSGDKDEPGWTPPRFDADVSAEALAEAEGNLIPDVSAEVSAKADEPAVVSSDETKADEDENLYYYNESEKAEAEKEESGFTSIKDELKNRKHWEIPEEVKKSADDVRF